MPPKKKDKKDIVQTEMFSVRRDQYDRLTKLSEKEGRSRREIFERMLNKYESD